MPCPIYPTQTLPYRPPRHPPRQASGRPFFCIFFNLSFSSQNGCFLASPGTSKSTQNRLLGQKLAPQADFLVIFWPFLLLPCFLVARGSIFDVFLTFFSMHVSTSLSVLFKPPNLQNHRHGQCFEHFSCLSLLCFFLQKHVEKSTENGTLEKRRKMTPPGL